MDLIVAERLERIWVTSAVTLGQMMAGGSWGRIRGGLAQEVGSLYKGRMRALEKIDDESPF